MKKAILILLTVLLAVSCSQVVYDNLPPVEIGGKYSTTLTATQDGTSTALKLRFNAVPYIAQYGYDINGSDIEEIPDSEIKVVGGADYEFTISSEDIGNQYNGEIYLYGKVPSDVGTEEWVNIGSTEYSIAIEGTAPVVNLYARNETEAVLYLDDPPAEMMYKVDVKEDSSGDPIEELSVSNLLPDMSDGMLHISNLESGQSYIFDVYQSKILPPQTVLPQGSIHSEFDGRNRKQDVSCLDIPRNLCGQCSSIACAPVRVQLIIDIVLHGIHKYAPPDKVVLAERLEAEFPSSFVADQLTECFLVSVFRKCPGLDSSPVADSLYTVVRILRRAVHLVRSLGIHQKDVGKAENRIIYRSIRTSVALHALILYFPAIFAAVSDALCYGRTHLCGICGYPVRRPVYAAEPGSSDTACGHVASGIVVRT